MRSRHELENDPREIEARVQRYGSTMHYKDQQEYERIMPLHSELRREIGAPVLPPANCRYEPASRISTNCRHCGGSPGDHK